VLANLNGLNADVLGLEELENDGFYYTSAIIDLLAGLNALQPPFKQYAAIKPFGDAPIGTDAITSAIIYRPALLYVSCLSSLMVTWAVPLLSALLAHLDLLLVPSGPSWQADNAWHARYQQ
jgi:hypothetical protein